MEPKEILLELRTKRGLSQEQLAEQVHVTRQAVSRWETGETVPNTETLKLLSRLFDVSINTLLGSPRQLICQCLSLGAIGGGGLLTTGGGVLLGILGLAGMGVNYLIYKRLLRSGKEKYAFEIIQLAREISEGAE